MNRSTPAVAIFALRFRDFDYLGHMTATSYLALVEEARVQWLADTEPTGLPSYVVAEQRLTFHSEVLPADSPVTITLSGEVMSESKFEVTETITGPSGRIHATSQAVLVAWDREQRRPRSLTEAERGVLKGRRVQGASAADSGYLHPSPPQGES